MYYRDTALFATQRIVDDMVERIALTLQVPRAELGVSATPKGLVAGPVFFGKSQGRESTQHATSQLIPDPAQGQSVSACVDWVLIVEKDAIFEMLMSHSFLKQSLAYHISGTGCLVTGKGYPDVATRWLLSEIAKQCPRYISTNRALFYVLVDADPHGIDILRIYATSLTSTRVVWIGLRSSDWLNMPRAVTVPLSATDRRKAMSLLKCVIPSEWRCVFPDKA